RQQAERRGGIWAAHYGIACAVAVARPVSVGGTHAARTGGSSFLSDRKILCARRPLDGQPRRVSRLLSATAIQLVASNSESGKIQRRVRRSYLFATGCEVP